MDDAQVTACDKSAALSECLHPLLLLGGCVGRGCWGRVCGPLTADPTHPVEPEPAGPGQPAGDASSRAPGSEVSPMNTEVEGISLEQWRRLQDLNRPKWAFDHQKTQSALPAGAVMIHQTKHGRRRNGKLPEQELDRLDRPSTDNPFPGQTSIGHGPCASGRARVTKRKNQKPRPSLGLWQ